MNGKLLRVVLDTNVLVSLLVFQDERFQVLRRLWTTRAIEVLSDDALRQELLRVLNYPEFIRRCCAEQALAFYDAHVLPAQAVQSTSLPLCRDNDDQKFIWLAAGGDAAILITDDKQLLRMSNKLPFQVETPLKFQRRFA